MLSVGDMPIHHELPTLAAADLAQVTGGTGDDLSAMLPMLMMKNRQQPAAPPAAPAAPAIPSWTPKITVDGVAQQLTNNGAGNYSTSTSLDGDGNS